MGVIRRATIAVLVVLVACTQSAPEPSPTPTVSPSPSPTPSPSPAPPLQPAEANIGTFDSPIVVGGPEGDPRLFVGEKGGRIMIVKGGSILSTPFLDIRGLVSDSGERGLLGFAFAPDYPASGLVYVHYSNNNGDTRIVEYKVSSDPDRLDPDSARTILALDQPQSNHNGGTMTFDEAGMLVIALGDGGGGGDPGNRAQNLNTLLGKLLRIDPSVPSDGKPYGIPSDNPFVGKPGLDEIWAYGLRNPWRFAFDPSNGDLYVADVGQNRWEEINWVPKDLQAGANYGWRAYEGDSRFTQERIDESRLIRPVHVYSLAEGRCAVIGGHPYRGSATALTGRYLFADWCDGLIRSFVIRGGEATDLKTHPELQADRLAAFGEDSMGEVYYGSTSGGLFKIVPE